MTLGARHARVGPCLALVLGLCTACGWSEDVSVMGRPSDDVHWHGRPGEQERAWGLTYNYARVLQLPEARIARFAGDTPIPRLYVNLLRSGDMKFKGHVWPLETGEAEGRRMARVALQNEPVRLCADPDLRAEDGTTSIPVAFHADREVPWRIFRTLLPILRDPAVRTRHVQWAVHRSVPSFTGRPRDHLLDGLLAPPGVESPDASSTPLDVQLVARPDAGLTVVRIEGVGPSRSFGPQPEDFEDADFLANANATWDQLETDLPARVEGHRTARLRVDDAQADVWLAYVVKTVDLLFGAGIEEIWMPDEGTRLVAPPPETGPPPETQDDPVVTPGILRGCLLAVLVAFAITFLPRTRRRRRR